MAAEDLYKSQLFAKSKAYAKSYSDRWFILSAKHGLLKPGSATNPYNITLNKFTKARRAKWAQRVYSHLRPLLYPGDRVIILAPRRYREELSPMIEADGFDVNEPLKGRKIGQQLHWLKKKNDPRADDLERFYSLLRRLESCGGQGRPLADYNGRSVWPARGVYFFREPGETRLGGEELRVVRVGTHAVGVKAASTLWQRLRSHRGGASSGGNHRGSIFRLDVGDALLKKNGTDVPSWGKGKTARKEVRAGERDHEQAVSKHIGAMSILWLEINDEPGRASDRALIEKQAIRLISGMSGPLDPPSPTWLGRLSTEAKIRDSGLWNKKDVFGEYDPKFLDLMERYVDAHCQKMKRASIG